MRRLRKNDFIRRLVQENLVTPNDLIYPLFVSMDKTNSNIQSMPSIKRFSLDNLIKECGQVWELGIPAVALFPQIEPSLKTVDGIEATNPEGLIPHAVSTIKAAFPHLGVITDAALDPYTSHGQDGIIDESGYVLNDETNLLLAEQSLVCANAGADVIAPSDMMDGRIQTIRTKLDQNGKKNTAILSYAAKYASAFYGPFREAVGSDALGKIDKKTYQMNPSNSNEAITEVELDLQEGADMILIKPGMAYLDILYRVKQKFGAPTFAYQVSGEYSMMKGAIDQGWLSEAVILESMLAFKRAGADGVLTYFAIQAARMLA